MSQNCTRKSHSYASFLFVRHAETNDPCIIYCYFRYAPKSVPPTCSLLMAFFLSLGARLHNIFLFNHAPIRASVTERTHTLDEIVVREHFVRLWSIFNTNLFLEKNAWLCSSALNGVLEARPVLSKRDDPSFGAKILQPGRGNRDFIYAVLLRCSSSSYVLVSSELL